MVFCSYCSDVIKTKVLLGFVPALSINVTSKYTSSVPSCHSVFFSDHWDYCIYMDDKDGDSFSIINLVSKLIWQNRM